MCISYINLRSHAARCGAALLPVSKHSIFTYFLHAHTHTHTHSYAPGPARSIPVRPIGVGSFNVWLFTLVGIKTGAVFDCLLVTHTCFVVVAVVIVGYCFCYNRCCWYYCYYHWPYSGYIHMYICTYAHIYEHIRQLKHFSKINC